MAIRLSLMSLSPCGIPSLMSTALIFSIFDRQISSLMVGYNADSPCFLYPCLDRQHKVIATCHIFNCTEFGTIKNGIIKHFPFTKILYHSDTPKRVSRFVTPLQGVSRFATVPWAVSHKSFLFFQAKG